MLADINDVISCASAMINFSGQLHLAKRLTQFGHALKPERITPQKGGSAWHLEQSRRPRPIMTRFGDGQKKEVHDQRVSAVPEINPMLG